MFVKMYLLGKSENIFRSKSRDNDRVWPHPAIEHWWIILIAQAGLLPASQFFLIQTQGSDCRLGYRGPLFFNPERAKTYILSEIIF